MKPGRFRHFAAIDWSGAAGERHSGIAVALCGEGVDPPRLVRPGHRWSRAEVLDWLLEELPESTIAGFDMGISLPFADRGAFFPGWEQSPGDARGLWRLVEALCAEEPYLGAARFADHPQAARHFRRHGGRTGDRFGAGRGRLRVTEHAQAELGCSPSSNFNLVGAAQVGKASLAGMRLLNRLAGRLPVWPIDPVAEAGSVVVEIYTAIAAIAAGRRAGKSKVRDHAALDAALIALGSRPLGASGAIPDHASDALITAAWLRGAAHDPALWSPRGLDPAIAATEGWTFGAR